MTEEPEEDRVPSIIRNIGTRPGSPFAFVSRRASSSTDPMGGQVREGPESQRHVRDPEPITGVNEEFYTGDEGAEAWLLDAG